MIAYKVTAVVPTPVSDPRKPYFSHHASTAPTKAAVNGEAGREISVTTTHPVVAEALRKTFESAKFLDATIIEVEV